MCVSSLYASNPHTMSGFDDPLQLQFSLPGLLILLLLLPVPFLLQKFFDSTACLRFAASCFGITFEIGLFLVLFLYLV